MKRIPPSMLHNAIYNLYVKVEENKRQLLALKPNTENICVIGSKPMKKRPTLKLLESYILKYKFNHEVCILNVMIHFIVKILGICGNNAPILLGSKGTIFTTFSV